MKEKRLLIQINCQLGHELADFERCANFVGNLFYYNLLPVMVKGVKKINIDFADSKDLSHIWTSDSILTMIEKFPFDLFETCDLNGKISLIAKETYKCLIMIYGYLTLDLVQLDIVYKKILDDNYRLNHTILERPNQKTSKTFKVAVVADFFLDYTKLSVNFRNSNNYLIMEVPLFKTTPGWFSYSRLIKTGKWIDKKTFELSSSTKEINFRVSVDGRISTRYSPIDREIDGIKEEINFFTLERSFEL